MSPYYKNMIIVIKSHPAILTPPPLRKTDWYEIIPKFTRLFTKIPPFYIEIKIKIIKTSEGVQNVVTNLLDLVIPQKG